MLPPTDVYTSRATSYARGRPGYPLASLTPLASVAGVAPPAVLADVGAGTGILTGSLLRLRYRVRAIEPNPAMRTVLLRTFGNDAACLPLAGSAEATGLPARSVDAITMGQSLHWFDPARTRREFARVLRPGGALLALWNEVRCRECAFCPALDELLAALLDTYAEAKAKDPDPVALMRAVAPGEASVRVYEVRHEQALTRDGLWNRVDSTSYAPGRHDTLRPLLEHRLAELFRHHAVDGRVVLHYTTTTVLAFPAGAAA
ncbi:MULTISPECIES: class I SAM-dependent methyltransferase [unclassified Streptomyces]|uniref:class I SAM-dependent methyltransferase n=1 Tax=unclassified Streptomyces TaxID=2593676 RepID=UPI002E2ACC82|nr:class I SAM-dependent methyltransferase [Streptomyces sp. NBC_01439]